MKMNKLQVASACLCGLVSLVAADGAAYAASPAYCALYAREYTAQFATGSDADAAIASEQRIQEQSFSQCLNMDVEPAFPETSVYFGATVEEITGIDGAFAEIAEGDTEPDGSDIISDDVPMGSIVDEPVAEAAEPDPPPERTAIRSSGPMKLKAFTPEWEAWCREHYPNSFDELTGMVTPLEGKPKLCLSGS